jgi:hypothetical protein
MININAAFLHDLFKITVGDRVAEIEKDCEKDHVLREVRTLEIDHCPTSPTRYVCPKSIAPLRTDGKAQKLCDRTGNSRHCAPVRTTHKTASINNLALQPV